MTQISLSKIFGWTKFEISNLVPKELIATSHKKLGPQWVGSLKKSKNALF